MSLSGASIAYILGDAIRSLRENLATTILTAITLGFSLSIFAVFLFVFLNMNSVISSWGDRTHIVAYVKDSAVAEGVENIRQGILKIPGVRTADFVSKEKALNELKEELKGHESILEGVDENPLPASFDIKVGDTYKNPSQVTYVVDKLKALAWVEDVQYSQEWVEKFSAFLRFIELAALVIGIFLAAATVFIISNTIRLTVYARKDEIEVMSLVGASDAFIKIPFLIEGMLQGLIGGIMSACILGIGRLVIISKIPAYFNFVVASPFPYPVLIGILIFTGILMGTAGSLISMGRFLKV
ncbi:MAG: ABC transporter permease [Deltaproteobacteria bacterium]|nr:ABC transporter permease [Deltaproteobacteria bacterium]